jgi:thymidylate synthase (FAD)
MIEVKYLYHGGDDLTVVNAARVSFNKVSELECIDMQKGKYAMKHQDEKLIKYLAKHKHISPFGHCFASFHVKAPVFVARQLVKHKFLRWNEISRRYVDEAPEFYTPDVWRGRSSDKKQGSEGEVKTNANVDHFHDIALKVYTQMIDEGVAPEQARMVLPQSMMTEWYWSGSLDAFADMCALRCKPDTQYESQLVANQIDDVMSQKFPMSWEALRMYAE